MNVKLIVHCQSLRMTLTILTRTPWSQTQTLTLLPEQKREAEFTTLLYDGTDLTNLESYLLLYQFAWFKEVGFNRFDILAYIPHQAKSAPSFYNLNKHHIESCMHYCCTKCHRLVDVPLPQWLWSGFVSVWPTEPQLRRKLEGLFC